MYKLWQTNEQKSNDDENGDDNNPIVSKEYIVDYTALIESLGLIYHHMIMMHNKKK